MRDHILRTVKLIASSPDANDAELVDCLFSLGYETLQAELLIVFVPLGLARAIIRRLPMAESIKLADHAVVLRAGKELKVPFRSVPEFIGALRLGEETFTTGVIPREDFSKVAQLSVELILINKALFAGTPAGIIAPPVLMRLGDVETFDDWYAQIKEPSG